MTRRLLVTALLALSLVLAGCAASGTNTSTTYSTSVPPETTTTTGTPTAGTSTTTTPSTTTSKLGTQWLSVSKLNESRAMRFNDSERADFEDLSKKRQRVVEHAINCSSSLTLSDEFDFNNKDRVKVVRYEGTYYYLRVTIA